MKIVEPKYEILTDISEGGIKELQQIERVARSCLPVTGPLPTSWHGTVLRALRKRAHGTATTRRRSLAGS